MIGLQLIGALGTLCHIPVSSSLYVLNVLFRLGNLFLYRTIARKLNVPYFYLIPFFMIITINYFQSMIRAEQEEFVLFFSLLAIYFLLEIKIYKYLCVALCFASIFLIKGLIVQWH